MESKRFDRNEILQYIKDGWYFRIKTVKGRRYITRRKGKVERSLGPFDQELWDFIVQTLEKFKPLKKIRIHKIKTEDKSSKKQDWVLATVKLEEKQRSLEKKISLHRGVRMMTSCMYRDNEGYCSYWGWDEKPRFFMMLDDLYGEKSYRRKLLRVEKTMVDKWVVWAYPWYCSSCSAYRPHK